MQAQPGRKFDTGERPPQRQAQSCTVLRGQGSTVLARPKTPHPGRRHPCHTVTLSGQLAQCHTFKFL